MASAWTPKFRYPHTSGAVWPLVYPMKYWTRRQTTIGGRREAAAGGVNVATRTIRRDYLLDVVIRVREGDLDAMELFVAWAQDNPQTAFDFWPDLNEAEVYQCLLISPAQGEDFAPTRSDMPSNLEASLTLRRTSGAAWPLSWYSD